MRSRHPVAAFTLVVFLLAAAGGARAAADPNWASRSYAALRALQAQTRSFSSVQLDSTWGSVKRISGSYAVPGATGEARAREFLKRHGAIFGVPADLSGMTFLHKVTSLLGDHVYYQQTYSGIPVLQATLGIHIDRQGRVYQADSTFVPNLNPKLGIKVQKTSVLDIVNAYLRRSRKATDRPRIQWCIWAQPGCQTQAWEVSFKPGDGRGSWWFVIDSLTGKVLKAKSTAMGAVATANVFDANPIKTLDTDRTRPFYKATSPVTFATFYDGTAGRPDVNDTFSAYPLVYKPVILVDLTTNGGGQAELFGPNVRITPSWMPGPTLVPTPTGWGPPYDFTVTRESSLNDGIFEAANVYHHVDQFARYLRDAQKGLGFQNFWVRDFYAPTTTWVPYIYAATREVWWGGRTADMPPAGGPPGACNGTTCSQTMSYYDPDYPCLHFPLGGTADQATGAFTEEGVDTAEDADVVLHEYAHALMDAAIISGPRVHLGSDDTQAMAEGFADYQACWWAEFRNRAGRDPAGFGQWMNAAALNGATPPGNGALRHVNSNHHLSLDNNPGLYEAQYRGQIWSAALWDIKNRVGYRIANRAIYEHHYLRTGNDTMAEAAQLLLAAHVMLDGGQSAALITQAFVQRGILTDATDVTRPQVTSVRTTDMRTIRVVFNEAMNQASVNQNRSGGSVAGTCSQVRGQAENIVVLRQAAPNEQMLVDTVGLVSPNTMVITLNPSTKLTSTAEQPWVQIIEVADKVGNRLVAPPNDCYRGQAADGVPPQIVSVTKFSTTQVDVACSEPLDASSCTPIPFRVSGRNPVTRANRAVTACTQPSPNVLRLTVDCAFATTERPILTQTGNIYDLALNRLPAGRTIVGAP